MFTIDIANIISVDSLYYYNSLRTAAFILLNMKLLRNIRKFVKRVIGWETNYKPSKEERRVERRATKSMVAMETRRVVTEVSRMRNPMPRHEVNAYKTCEQDLMGYRQQQMFKYDTTPRSKYVRERSVKTTPINNGVRKSRNQHQVCSDKYRVPAYVNATTQYLPVQSEVRQVEMKNASTQTYIYESVAEISTQADDVCSYKVSTPLQTSSAVENIKIEKKRLVINPGLLKAVVLKKTNRQLQ